MCADDMHIQPPAPEGEGACGRGTPRTESRPKGPQGPCSAAWAAVRGLCLLGFVPGWTSQDALFIPMLHTAPAAQGSQQGVGW